jgi:outer membrane protein assembly factor BamA
MLRTMAPLITMYYWGERHYDQEKFIKKRDAAEKKFDDKIARSTSPKKINNYQFRKQKKLDKFNSRIENGNLFMQWGEPISVFDSSMVETSEERFRAYLFAKGYFKNKVTSRVSSIGKLVTVTYNVEPGPAYIIDSIFFEIQDTTIFRLVDDSQKDSFIKKGDRYDQDNLTRERERIDLLLKDHGFYDFSRQYIEFEVDTSLFAPEKKVTTLVIIKDPAKRGYHKQFRIDSVNFTTDAGTNNPGGERKTRPYRQIQYSYYEDNYNLKILSQRVFLQPDELYSRSKTLNTQRQLANVDAFKFININYDTSNGKFIANIFSSPLPRYEWSNEAGVNVTQGYPGPFYNISFRKRNIFNGLENFDLSGRFGFEGVASATVQENFYKSTEAGVNASLTFPQFIWPFKERVRFKLAQYNPKTRFTAGYAFTDRPEYRRTAVSLNGTYSWQNNLNRAYALTPFSVSVIDTANLSSAFKNLLVEQGRLGNFSLLNSFRPSFVNSVIFGVTWNYNNYGNVDINSGFARAQIESGGTIWNFVDPSAVTQFDLEYFKYLRFSIDLRRINVINKTATLAYRFNGGVAYPYAINKSLPYEKFFFAGGSNSIRAWRPRRLGPGSFKPDSSANPVADGLFSYSIEKPAEILLEASVEIRKKLFGFVSGAVFIDAGNVWTFEERKRLINEVAVDNGNSQFKIDQFYKEIAVGTGFGLRFDFTFLILRFDVGMKVYDPAREENDRFVLDKVRFFKPYATQREDGTYTNFREPVIYNVGIGYSF